MKKIKIIFLTLIILATINTAFAVEIPNINSKYYGVYDSQNDELLYGENTKDKISIASMTKIMTAIIACENVSDLDGRLTIDTSIIYGKVDDELSTIGIYNGEKLTYYDLIATMLVGSAADSAVYLQNILCGSEENYIAKMNEKAKEIGMNNTNFSNVTGLDDENNYSTIEDVSKMLIYALKNETIRQIMSMKNYTTSDNNLISYSTIFSRANRNNINIKYIEGGKTGTTEDAGLCLASFAKDNEDNTELVCVVTGTSMYSMVPYNILDSEKIYDYVITNFSNKNIIKIGDKILTLSTINAKEDNIDFYADKDITKYLSDVDNEKIKIDYEGKNNISPKEKEGTKLGVVKVYYDNEEIGEYDIILNQKLHFSILKWINNNKVITSIVIIALVLVISCIVVTIKRKNSR